MKILSLFDGISCARVALERAGIPVEAYYASEVDKYALQISSKNYPDIVQVGDVKNLTQSYLCQGNICNFDLLIGGSPCQDLSIAKKDRKGLDGERSGLFWEYVRILKEVKPKYFILENVNSMAKEAKALITETLGVEPIMINASLVSAQNRKRLFWTNIPNVTLPEDRGILLKDILEQEVDEKYLVHSNNWRVKRNTVDVERKSRCLNASTFKGALNDGMSLMRVGQIGKGGQADRRYSPEGKSVGLSALGGGRGAKTGLYCISSSQKHATITEYKSSPLTQAMGTAGGHIPYISKRPERLNGSQNLADKDYQIRKLTTIECERLQGLEDNYTEGVSNTQRYKMLGNAFNVDVVAHILSFIRHT